MILTLRRSSYFYARSMAMKTKFCVTKAKLARTPVQILVFLCNEISVKKDDTVVSEATFLDHYPLSTQKILKTG